MRSKFTKNLGIVAMEEEAIRQDELQNEAEVSVNPEDEDHANSLETELIEVADHVGDAEEVSDGIEEGLEVAEALESMREVVNAGVQAGGLDRMAIAGIKIGLESFYNRVGINHGGVVTPAMESFGAVSSRQAATIALEADIKAKVASIWEAIKAAIKRAIDFIVGVYKKFFDAATKLEARGKKLAARGKDIKGAPNAKTFDSEKLAHALYIGSAVPNDEAGAKRLKDVVAAVYAGYPKLVDELTKVVEDSTKDAKAGPSAEDLKASTEGIARDAAAGLQDVPNPAAAGFEAAEGSIVKRSEELPGGSAVVFVLNPSAFDKSHGGVAKFNPKQAAPSNKAVGVVSGEAGSKIGELVAEVAGMIKGAKANVDKATAAKKKLSALADKASKADEGSKEALAVFKGTLALIDKPFLEVNRFALTTGKNLLDQVEQSFQQYGSKKAEKPADEQAAA